MSHNGNAQVISNDAILDFETLHYELFPFTKIVRAPAADIDSKAIGRLGLTHPFIVEGPDIYLAVELDIHHALSNGINLDDVWKDVSIKALHGEVAEHVSWETHVWFIAARLYHEVMILGATKVRPLIELTRIIESHNIAWAKVLQVSAKYSLGPGIFYVLSFTRDMLGANIPAEVLKDLDEQRRETGRLHDFGDFILKALGETVLLRPVICA